jgi:uncharacterized protein
VTTWTERLIDAMARRPGRTLAAVILPTIVVWLVAGQRFGWDPSRSPVDNRIELFFVEDDPGLVAYQTFKQRFGNDEDIVLCVSDPEGIFSPRALSLVADIGSRLETVPVVRGVSSLSTILHADDDAGTLRVERMYRGPVRTAEEAARVRARLVQNPAYLADLVSKDERATLLNVRLETFEDNDDRRAGILQAVRAHVDAAYAAAGRAEGGWRWGGVGVIEIALNDLSRSESNKFFGYSALVMALLLYVFLRRALAVVVALASVYAAVVLMVGVYLAVGLKLNFITSILPVMILVIGLTDCVYYVTLYYQERPELEARGLTKRQAVVRVIAHSFVPCLFNSITSAIGFLSFLSCRMPILRWFGLFAGVGLIIAFFTSVICCTVAFEKGDLRAPWRPDAPPAGQRAVAWLSDLVVRWRRTVLAGALGTLVVCLIGISRLEVDNVTLDYFYADHPVARDHAAILREFGPYLPLDVLVDAGETGGIQDPAVLRAMDGLQRETVEREEAIGSAMSITAVVKQLHRCFTGEYALPADRAAVEQELLFYDPERADDPLVLVDLPDYRLGRIACRSGTASAREGGEVLRRMVERARETFPPGTTVQPTGLAALYVTQTEYIFQGQVSSLALTFVLVFVIIAALLRSVRLALIAMPPNLLPVMGTLAFMGFAGLKLDSAALLIGSISLAVAVNDTLHFLCVFKEEHQRLGDVEEAVRRTQRLLAPAMVSTSAIVCVGFGVIAMADMWSMAVFGILTAVTMLTTLLGDLLLTPALLVAFAPRVDPGPAAMLQTP